METSLNIAPKPYKQPKNLIKTTPLLKVKNPPKPKAKYKYTEQYVSLELDTMLDDLAAHEQIKTKAELFETKEYSTKKFSQWRNKYSTSKRIDEKIKKIDDILESRLIKQGLTGKNFPFVIFLLKNHYGYQDKREVEQETTHVFKVTRGETKKVIDMTPKITDKNR